MSTHFTLDFSSARLVTGTLGLCPRMEFKTAGESGPPAPETD